MSNMNSSVLFDSLTSLYKEENFENKLLEEVSRSKRHKIPFSFLMLEIDSFHYYAENLEEDEINRVLISVARAIKQSTRDLDFCFRISGGRFYILMPYTDSFGATLVGEKIIDHTRKIKWLKVKITLKGGIVTYLRETHHPAQIIPLAEQKLEKARGLQGNRIYSDTSEINLFKRLDFYFRRKYSLLKYKKKQFLFEAAAIILILIFAGYYIQSLYTERERWDLQYQENFSPENIDTFWNVTSGQWNIENGQINTVPGESLSHVLTHRQNYTGNYRVMMEGFFEEGAHISDLSLILGGLEENPQKGYFVGIGSNENTRHKLLKLGEEISVYIDEPLQNKTKYRIEVEKIDQHVIVKVNGKTVFNYWDLFPLNDIRHNKVSLYTFFDGINITRFEVYSKREPRMIPLYNIPDTLFRLGFYEQAYYEYRDLSDVYARTDYFDVLIFKKALCLMKLQRFDDAEVLLKRVIYTGRQEDLIPYAKQQKVQILVEKGQFGLALSLLKDLINEYQEDEQIQSLYSSYMMALAEALSSSHPFASNDFYRSYIQRMQNDPYGCAYAKIQMMDNFLEVNDFDRFSNILAMFNMRFTHFRDFSFQRDRLTARANFMRGRQAEAFEELKNMKERYPDLYYTFPQLYSQEALYHFNLKNYSELENIYEYVTLQYGEPENHETIHVKCLWAFSRVLEGEAQKGIEMLISLTDHYSSHSVYRMYPYLYLGYSYYLLDNYYLAREAFIHASEQALKQPEILRNAQIMIGLTYLAERNAIAAEDWFQEVMMNRSQYTLEHLCARYILEKISSTEFLQKFASEKYRLLPLAYFIMAENALFQRKDDLAREYYQDSMKYSRWNEFPTYLLESRIAIQP